MMDTESDRGEKVPILIIACGALAQDIVAVKELNGWDHLHLTCLDAELHNRPDLIAPKLRQKIAQNRHRFDNIFVAYADCGSGGEIDKVLREEGIDRLPGAHCYSFFASEDRFVELAEEALGTFYVTDFLLQHFERLVVKGLKLDRYPELREQFFGNYTRLMYLSQCPTESLIQKAKDAADALGLAFDHYPCGYGDLETGIETQVIKFA
jgi:hypothetical protein